jgi:hypothetical protein
MIDDTSILAITLHLEKGGQRVRVFEMLSVPPDLPREWERESFGSYDKVNTFHYGDNCPRNFEETRSSYKATVYAVLIPCIF